MVGLFSSFRQLNHSINLDYLEFNFLSCASILANKRSNLLHKNLHAILISMNLQNIEFFQDEVPVPSPSPIEEEVKTEESEAPKEEDPDPHLHSLLICDEEIPRSPAPPSEPPAVQENKMKSSVLEMPFASAPSTSNNKSMFLEQKKMSPAPSVELHGQHGEREREHRVQNSTVLDNTPPTTPESSISNLSPRG